METTRRQFIQWSSITAGIAALNPRAAIAKLAEEPRVSFIFMPGIDHPAIELCTLEDEGEFDDGRCECGQHFLNHAWLDDEVAYDDYGERTSTMASIICPGTTVTASKDGAWFFAKSSV